jgi:hypothetical protein
VPALKLLKYVCIINPLVRTVIGRARGARDHLGHLGGIAWHYIKLLV